MDLNTKSFPEQMSTKTWIIEVQGVLKKGKLKSPMVIFFQVRFFEGPDMICTVDPLIWKKWPWGILIFLFLESLYLNYSCLGTHSLWKRLCIQIHFDALCRDSKRMRPEKMTVANSDCKFTPQFWIYVWYTRHSWILYVFGWKTF